MTGVGFFVPGKPRGKGRPRFDRKGHAYTDDATRAYEVEIRSAYLNQPVRFYAAKGQAVKVSLTICMPVPVSWPKKRQEAALLGCELPQVKPDADNVVKVVLDALNGFTWDDDTQVTEIAACKLYVQRGSEGVMVLVEEVGKS